MAALEAPAVDVLPWLKSLPVAPEYHPTVEEFSDPISYILKIEEEASRYGICKIVPPLPAPSRKAAAANLARSVATFTTRQQQIGFCPRRARPVQKPVWQSGEWYTLADFEAKARAFERGQLRRAGKKSVTALEVETMFWKACADKPFFSVEYANDMPGSAFHEDSGGAGAGETLEGAGWNMRGISRSNLSLLRFMKEEIPGVTSPMVYVAMMFSWFAWHVEDHDLHSLNYLHLGASKTWYGVPRDAALAFEDVVRVHGYGDEVNPLVTFAILGEKTTIMSPEVLVGAGVPCCRLVQNAGDFVVTFPRAYHTGFSHGYNCGEASNIATPGWLRVAKEAAIRRASICYPPMLSHFQLLYNLALTFCSSVPKSLVTEPRSSRLKDKKRVGEITVKQLFVEDMIHNNESLNLLAERGSSCILLPQTYFQLPRSSNSRIPPEYKMKVKSRLPLGSSSRPKTLGVTDNFLHNDATSGRNSQSSNDFWLASGRSSLMPCEGKQDLRFSSKVGFHTSDVDSKDTENGENSIVFSDDLFDHGLFSCVTCGVLSYACVAVIRPTEAAAKHILSSGGSFINGGMVDADVNYVERPNSSCSDKLEKNSKVDLVDIIVHAGDQLQAAGEQVNITNDAGCSKGFSALDLLASAYEDSSDSDETLNEQLSPSYERNGSERQSFSSKTMNHLGCCLEEDSYHEAGSHMETCNLNHDAKRELHQSTSDFNFDSMERSLMAIPIEVTVKDEILSEENRTGCMPSFESSDSYSNKISDSQIAHHLKDGTSFKDHGFLFHNNPSRDVPRMHIFCMEHAVEVERHLQAIGGVEVLIICHPDYLKLEKKARSLANELSVVYFWKDIRFKEVNAVDEEKIQTAIDDEEALPGNGDWAVKLGLNLYYASSLSKSPLYSKQMPYNAIIYQLFGQCSHQNPPTKIKVYSSRRSKKQKRFVVAGRWCGKVWMSNQVHPYLVHKDVEEEEPSKELQNCSNDGANKFKEELNGSGTSETFTGKRVRKRRIPQKDQRFLGAVDDEEEEEQQPPKSSRGNKRLLRSKSVKRPAPVHNELSRKTITNRKKPYLEDETEDDSGSRLRKRPSGCKGIISKPLLTDNEVKSKKQNKSLTAPSGSVSRTLDKDEGTEYDCDIEGCSMGFSTKQDLLLHKKNICLAKGCGKKFFSHKYLVQHRRVHLDDRPLKCPWKGCKMSFKWAWARTEHIRVHTGARPYVCKEPGCSQTFRFVSDFSRHKRKTGHSLKKKGKG